jgi:HTH-type transcriptional regulator, transcriptional repressor of NAD biosynthesis genes
MKPLVRELVAGFVERVCVLGGESSGKSTLAQALAAVYDTRFVTEYGRELWEQRRGLLVFEDLLAVAERQLALEQQEALHAKRFLFCDTSPLSTRFYSMELFGNVDARLEALALTPYDHYVLCAPDFRFVQDGTRRDASFRQLQHAYYLSELARMGIDYLLVSGSVASRVGQVSSWLAAK